MPNLRTYSIAAVLLTVASRAFPQPTHSKSAELATRLVELMAQRKLESVAAREHQSPDRFVAALHFPGQLLVVSAKYAAPTLLRERLLSHDYRDVYLQLQSAGEADDKFFVQDLGADGIRAAADSSTVDIVYEAVKTRTIFNGDWRNQGLSEQTYRRRFDAADQRYAHLLAALSTELTGMEQHYSH
jgi:hypothetical protein